MSISSHRNGFDRTLGKTWVFYLIGLCSTTYQMPSMAYMLSAAGTVRLLQDLPAGGPYDVTPLEQDPFDL